MTEEVKNAPQEDSVDTTGAITDDNPLAGEEQDPQSAGKHDAETDGTTSGITPIDPQDQTFWEESVDASSVDISDSQTVNEEETGEAQAPSEPEGVKEVPPVEAHGEEETLPGDPDLSTEEVTQAESQDDEPTAAKEPVAKQDTGQEEAQGETATVEDESKQPEEDEQTAPITSIDETEDAVQTNAQDEDQPVENEPVAEHDVKQEETQGEEETAATVTPPGEDSPAPEEESGQLETDEKETLAAQTEEGDAETQENAHEEEQPAAKEPADEKDTKQEEVPDDGTADGESIEPQPKGKVLSFYRRLNKKTFIAGTGILLLVAGSIGFTVVPGFRSTDTITSTLLGGRPDTSYDMEFFLPLDVGYEKTQFVKVTVALELTDKELQKEVEENLSQLRQEVIDLILTKSPKEVKSSKGKKELRSEITARLNNYLLKDCIKDTYFTELVIL